jgi:hypothetical protein
VEKTENKVEKTGKFSAVKKRHSIHHVSPHISPRTHHKNTTFCTPLFPKHPLKAQQNNKTPARARVSFFF